MVISPKQYGAMAIVWKIERYFPNRLLESASGTEYQRSILAKIESTDYTIKQTLEDCIDILATGWESIYRTDYLVYLEVKCGMNNAQCTCWE